VSDWIAAEFASVRVKSIESLSAVDAKCSSKTIFGADKAVGNAKGA